MHDNYYADIAARLNALREAKGCTAREMSLSLGRSESYINKIENNRIRPSMNVFFEICEELGVSPKDFFDVKNSHPAHLEGLIDNLKKLDRESLTYIDGIVRKINNT